MKPNTDDATASLSFEQSFTKLETIVADLEKGQLGLDDIVKQFSEGMALVKQCQQQLTQAEQQVVAVLRENQQIHEKPFDPATDDD